MRSPHQPVRCVRWLPILSQKTATIWSTSLVLAVMVPTYLTYRLHRHSLSRRLAHLLKGDLRAIVRALALGEGVMRNIRQNLFLAFFYNSLGVPLAAGVLYPAFGLLLNPMIAAAAMSLSSLCVIGNALRLQRLRLE